MYEHVHAAQTCARRPNQRAYCTQYALFAHCRFKRCTHVHMCARTDRAHCRQCAMCTHKHTDTEHAIAHAHKSAHTSTQRHTSRQSQKGAHIETHRGQYALCRQASAPTHSRQCSRPAIKRRQAGKGGDAHPLFSIPSSYISSSSPSYYHHNHHHHRISFLIESSIPQTHTITKPIITVATSVLCYNCYIVI